MRTRLKCGNETVEAQGYDACRGKDEAPPLPDTLPHQVRTSDLGHGSKSEQTDGSDEGHPGTIGDRFRAQRVAPDTARVTS